MSARPSSHPRSATVDRLRVALHASAESAGDVAASWVGSVLRRRLSDAGEARIVFAAAPSQDAVLQSLQREADIDWSRVTAFQMDEYIGIEDGHPQAFSTYLHEHIHAAVRPGRVHRMRPDAEAESEAARYAGLLTEAPIDVVCMGIGENGHIAFNDPGVADFDDPLAVKAVQLDSMSRQQQVNDGCFPSLDDVPTHAVTVTVPVLLSASTVICSVSGNRKTDAVRRTLFGDVCSDCPASALRTHPDAWLFLDSAATPDELVSAAEQQGEGPQPPT